MKDWLKRHGVPFFMIITALFILYNGVHSFIFNRQESDVIYRWELSSFSRGLVFLTIGFTQIFEVNDRKRFAHIFNMICSSILIIFGFIAIFAFHSDFGFFDDMLWMVVIPLFMIIRSVSRLCGIRKDQHILTKKQLKTIDVVLTLAAIVFFVFMGWMNRNF